MVPLHSCRFSRGFARALETKITLADRLAREGGVEQAIQTLDSAFYAEVPRIDLDHPEAERRAVAEIKASLLLRDLLKSRSPADAADYLRHYVARLKQIVLSR